MPFVDQLDSTALLVGAAVTLSLLCWLSTRRAPGLPPGPGPALPLLGHLHLMERDPRARFQQWRRQYGDVFSLYMGSRLVVVFCGYRVMKEAFVKMADVFSHRPHMFITDKISKNMGIILSSGDTWREQRKTSLEILREMGMGKNLLAEKIQEEVTHFMRAIEDLQGAPSDLQALTSTSVSNNICSIVFGQRYQYDDPVFNSYLKAVNENVENLAGSALVNFLSYLEYLPGDLFKVKKVLSNVKLVKDMFLQPQIDRHQATYREGEEATDYIYAYLREMKKQQLRGTDTTLNEGNLQIGTGDLFLAGTETTSTAIAWALLFFLHHPHVQDKCYQELCDVVGTNRLPSTRDRVDMVYLEATINEVLRKGSVAPFSVQHATPYDVGFRGYVIPKDAIIMPFMDSVLQDPDIWGDPENFRPERFIGPDGKLNKPEEFIPFGTGRRVCLGESLARMELFLYLSSLIQRFHFLPPEPDTLPSLEGKLGAAHSPKPYKIKAVLRD